MRKVLINGQMRETYEDVCIVSVDQVSKTAAHAILLIYGKINAK
jgi:hypothetical protein